MSPTFQLVKDCFKMFVLFGLNPFYAGKTVPFVIYSLGREIHFDKFSSSLIKIYLFPTRLACIFSMFSLVCMNNRRLFTISDEYTKSAETTPVRTG